MVRPRIESRVTASAVVRGPLSVNFYQNVQVLTTSTGRTPLRRMAFVVERGVDVGAGAGGDVAGPEVVPGVGIAGGVGDKESRFPEDRQLPQEISLAPTMIPSELQPKLGYPPL